jgi:hypothetical protein
MYGMQLIMRPETYAAQLQWSAPYRQYIIALSASAIGMHMIPLYSMMRLRSLRLHRVRVMADELQDIIRYLSELKHIDISTIVATSLDATFDMFMLPGTLERVTLVVDMPRVFVHVGACWRHLHIRALSDGFVTLMDLGQLESLFVYGATIFANCDRNQTLKRVWFESPDMLLYNHLLGKIPCSLDSLTLHGPDNFMLLDQDIRTRQLRISARTVYLRNCQLPTDELTVFARLLLSACELGLTTYEPKTLIVQEHLVVQ